MHVCIFTDMFKMCVRVGHSAVRVSAVSQDQLPYTVTDAAGAVLSDMH